MIRSKTGLAAYAGVSLVAVAGAYYVNWSLAAACSLLAPGVLTPGVLVVLTSRGSRSPTRVLLRVGLCLCAPAIAFEIWPTVSLPPEQMAAMNRHLTPPA